MFSNLDIKKISLWLFIIMVCSFIIAGSILATNGIDNTFKISSNGKSNHDLDSQKTFSSEGIKSISVNTTSTDINIVPTDSREITAHYYGTASISRGMQVPELNAELKGDRLSIEIKNKAVFNIGFNFINSKLILDVFIPKTYSGDLNIHTVSGNTKIGNLAIGRMEFTSVSGGLISDLRTEDANINTTSGSVNLQHFEGNLDFSAVSGDLKVEYLLFNYNININTTSGNTKIYLPDQASYQINFNSVSGDLKNDFSYSAINRDKKNNVKGIVNKGTNKIDIDTVSGDVDIRAK